MSPSGCSGHGAESRDAPSWACFDIAASDAGTLVKITRAIRLGGALLMRRRHPLSLSLGEGMLWLAHC